MTNNTQLSIIMSEYNTHPDHLRASIDSIVNQTYENFELIVVIDGPDSNAVKIINSFNDPRIKILRNNKNRGLVHSLNKALRASKGRYVVRMDTDDISHPSRLERQLQFISSNTEYSVVGTRVVEFTESLEMGLLGKGGEKTKKDIMRGDTPVHPSVIMAKDDILSCGGYPNYQRAEDLALWMELLLKGKRIFVMDDTLLKYRVDPEDYKKRKLNRRQGEIRARLKFYPKLKAGPLEYFWIIKSIASGLLPSTLVRAYRQGFVLQRKEDYRE